MCGENHLWNTDVNLGSRIDKIYLTLNAGKLTSDGFVLPHDFDTTVNENGHTRENSDVDQKSGAFKVGFMPSEGHEYAFGINFVNSEWGLPL
jgi:iron complex outermembrane receptor protein